MAIEQEADRIMSSIERKGRVEGRRETLLRLLQVKFAEVPAEDRALLEKLSDDQLEEVSVGVLTTGSYADWREQLQKLSEDTD